MKEAAWTGHFACDISHGGTIRLCRRNRSDDSAVSFFQQIGSGNENILGNMTEIIGAGLGTQ